MEYSTLKTIKPSTVDHGSMANMMALAPSTTSAGSKGMSLRKI